MRLSTETQIMLQNLAAAGGSLRYLDLPYSAESVAEARHAGLVSDIDAGGWSDGGTLHMTEKGRKLAGIPIRRDPLWVEVLIFIGAGIGFGLLILSHVTDDRLFY